MRGCYEKIRSWCDVHGRDQCQQIRHSAKQRLKAVIDAMQPKKQMSDVEIYEICSKVINGNLGAEAVIDAMQPKKQMSDVEICEICVEVFNLNQKIFNSQRAEAVIDAMKPEQQMFDVEIYAICLEVITGNLEIFYGCSEEGEILKMCDYARWAIKQSQLSFPLDDAQKTQLQQSPLYEHLSETSLKIMLSGSGMSGWEPPEPELDLSQRLGLDKEFLCHCLEECGNRKEVLCALYDLIEPGGNRDEAIQKLISNGVLTKIARLLSPEIQEIIRQYPAAGVLIADLPPPPKPYRRTLGGSC